MYSGDPAIPAGRLLIHILIWRFPRDVGGLTASRPLRPGGITFDRSRTSPGMSFLGGLLRLRSLAAGGAGICDRQVAAAVAGDRLVCSRRELRDDLIPWRQRRRRL